MPKIYLSPSTQDQNPYVDQSGSEEYWMNLLADELEPYLYANTIAFVRNTPEMTAASSIAQAERIGGFDFYQASQRFQLPEGTYCIQTFSNLTEPFFISEQTRALTNWNNILIGLTNPKDVKNNAYFGVTDVKIDNKEGNYVVQTPKKKVLAELTIIIENIPKGTEMSGKALDCAWCLFPTQKNSDGEYGLPSIEPTEVELPTLLATESTLKSEVIRLMPTIQGSSSSHIYLRLLLPDETLQEFDITAPMMKVGGKYELRFKYEEMRPKMNLQTGINGWNDLNKEVEIK